MVHGHVLRRDDGHVLREVLEFEVKRKRKRGRPKKMQNTQVEKESKSVSLKKEDALDRVRWRVGVVEIAVRVGINPDKNWMMMKGKNDQKTRSES